MAAYMTQSGKWTFHGLPFVLATIRFGDAGFSADFSLPPRLRLVNMQCF